jgi:3-oxoacyl-[acyl-carrier-protein] synthase II
MQLEILEYKHTTVWDFETFLKDETFKQHLQEKFPLITCSAGSREINSAELCWTDYLQGKKRCKPMPALDIAPGGFTRRVGEYLNLTGENLVVQGNCASALYGLNIASMLSQANNMPVVVVCADNVNHPFDLWRFKSLGALDNDTGRPFDKSSKGFKMGLGIAMFLVKHPSVQFKLDVRATINKFAFYTNNEFTNPGSSDDIIKNIIGIDYKSVDFWNAHATGTPVGDIIEYEVFNKTIKQDIPIVSYKGHIGHAMSAAGAMEIALALDGKRDNILLPNIIHGEKIVNDDRIITESTSFTYKHMLKASLAFGGKTAIATIDLY